MQSLFKIHIQSKEIFPDKLKQVLKGEKELFELASKIIENEFSANQVKELCNQLNEEQDEWQFNASVIRVMRRKRRLP